MDLSSLTPSQEQAVRHQGGPLIVLAGPGTGKTRTLTYRIAHLIASGIARSDQILAVTFTNKAAEEMRSRIDQLGQGIDQVFSPLDFHISWVLFPLPAGEPFYHLINCCPKMRPWLYSRKRSGNNFPDFPTPIFERTGPRISWAKNALILPDSPETLPPWDTYPNWPSCYQAFQEKLGAGLFWDFDELLIQAVTLLERNPDLRADLQARLPYVFIDEFQDINPSQYRLFELLTRKNGEWMVIGDPNQAIYGFRGPSAEFFSRLQQECPSLTEITLEETFRLNQTVLAASSQVIEGTICRRPVRLISSLKGEPSLKVIALPSAEEEGEYIIPDY